MLQNVYFLHENKKCKENLFSADTDDEFDAKLFGKDTKSLLKSFQSHLA